MSVNSFADLLAHAGHEVQVSTYDTPGFDNGVANIAIECFTCCTVLVDYDNPQFDTPERTRWACSACCEWVANGGTQGITIGRPRFQDPGTSCDIGRCEGPMLRPEVHAHGFQITIHDEGSSVPVG